MPIQEIASATSRSFRNANPETIRAVSDLCFLAGFASIIGSIIAWRLQKGTEEDAKAERLGIFIGLWAPTFFILSNRCERYADRAEN